MDNEYKVSWIDTNPQNSSMNQQYVFKKNTAKKENKKEAEEDSYEAVLQENKNRYLSRYELKQMLDNVLKNLPFICADKLLVHSTFGFTSYLHDK